jgi:hypothetical protein
MKELLGRRWIVLLAPVMQAVMIERSRLVLQRFYTRLISPLTGGKQYLFAALEIQPINIIAKDMHIDLPVLRERTRRGRERALELARLPMETLNPHPGEPGVLHTGADQESSLGAEIVKDKILPLRRDRGKYPETISPALQEHVVKGLGGR